MNATIRANDGSAARAWKTIIAGGLLAGAIDLVFACTYHGIVSGLPPTRIMQAIASGLLGNAAFQGGLGAAAIGFIAHFAILIAAAAIFYATSRRFAFLVEHPVASGLVFGLGIYLTMNLVVVPLSAAPHFKSTTVSRIADFSVHVLLLGPAIALMTRRFGGRPKTLSN